MSSWNQIAEGPDSTCARVDHPNAEMQGDKLVNASARNECQEQKEHIGMDTVSAPFLALYELRLNFSI